MSEEATTMSMNRLANSGNKFQGNYKKVLCVCSAGLLRSPTAAWVLSNEPYNYNTRAVGMNAEYALVALDNVHLSWADEIVVMEPWMGEEVKKKLEQVLQGKQKKVYVLDVPDSFPYRDPELVKFIKESYNKEAAFQCEVTPGPTENENEYF